LLISIFKANGQISSGGGGANYFSGGASPPAPGWLRPCS